MNTQPSLQISRGYTLPDGPATIVCLPGVPQPGLANEALFAAVRRPPNAHVFVSGPGSTASALWCARAGARVTVWTANVAEARSLKLTFEKQHLTPPTCVLAADFGALKTGQATWALLHLPRGKALHREMFQLAAAMLEKGGQLAFVGAKNEGVKSALKIAQECFGQAGIVTRKGGYHAGLALRPPGEFNLPPVDCLPHPITVDGQPTQLLSCNGAFAHDRLDDGAAALIAGMQITPHTRVLDLGCGTGLAGLAALRRGAQVVFSDVSARAVLSTQSTLAANGYPEAEVYLDCGAGAQASASFDTVICNPPFHKGHGTDFETAKLLIKESARLLKAGGTLYLVANAFLRYQPWLKANFPKVDLAWENPRFRVWRGKK